MPIYMPAAFAPVNRRVDRKSFLPENNPPVQNQRLAEQGNQTTDRVGFFRMLGTSTGYADEHLCPGGVSASALSSDALKMQRVSERKY